MISEDNFFKNHFSEKAINNTRLETFTGDIKGKLTAGNTGSRFQPILDKLTVSYPAFTGDVTDVTVALNLQKGSTMTVEGVHKLFKTTMSAQEPFIANALGGRNKPEYLQFYPHKISEYSKCTQAEMITLTNSVKAAAIANATALGTTLAALLQGFAGQWTTTKTAQELKKGTVASNRTDRNDTRVALELDLCFAIDTIASIFPGDVETCKTFVDFSLLTTTPNRKHITKSGTILVSGKEEVANKLFDATDMIKIRNTGTNSDIEAYLAPSPSDAPTLSITVRPGKEVRKAAAELGLSTSPFLMIRNTSSVNEATFVAEYLE